VGFELVSLDQGTVVMLLSMFLNELLQINAGVRNMLPENGRSGIRVSGPASIEQVLVSLSRLVEFPGDEKVEASISVAVVIQSFDEGKHCRPVGWYVQGRMKTPIPFAPILYFRIQFQGLFILLEDLLRRHEVSGGKIGNRATQHVAFEDRSSLKKLLDFLRGEGGNDGSAVGNDGDKTFSGKMAERFPNGNSANLKFGSDGILT
jgi:hypothetical protein